MSEQKRELSADSAQAREWDRPTAGPAQDDWLEPTAPNEYEAQCKRTAAARVRAAIEKLERRFMR